MERALTAGVADFFKEENMAGKRLAVVASFVMSAFALAFAKESKSDKFFTLVESPTTTARDIKKEISGMEGLTRGDDKETLLMAALKADRGVAVITAILESGVDADKKTKQKKTAVMYACQYSSDAEVVDKVICYGTLTKGARKKRILAKDKSGMDSFAYLKKNQNASSVEHILAVLAKYADVPKDFSGAKAEPAADIPQKKEEPVPVPVPIEEPVAKTENVSATDEAVPDANPAPVESAPSPAAQAEETKIPVEEAFSAPVVEEAAVPERTEDAGGADDNGGKEARKEISPYRSVYLYDFADDGSDEGLIPIAIEIEGDSMRKRIESVNEQDSDGRTKLMIAARDGNIPLMKDLIYSGASIDMSDKDGWTALMFAARHQGDRKTVDFLLSNGANFRKKNGFGVTALMLAAVYNPEPSVTEALLEGRSATESDVRGAFVQAVAAESPLSVLSVFLARGISLNTPFDDKTPLMYAAESNRTTAVIGWLLSNGASKNYRTIDGKSAFDFAAENRKLPHDETYWALSVRK